MTTEYIGLSTLDEDSWICQCGNTPIADGFHPCDATGEEVDPTPEAWDTGWYVCARCGRIIDPSTRAVVGRRGR